jgi:uncharacterized Zn finger protein (UPF0148 family)
MKCPKCGVELLQSPDLREIFCPKCKATWIQKEISEEEKGKIRARLKSLGY